MGDDFIVKQGFPHFMTSRREEINNVDVSGTSLVDEYVPPVEPRTQASSAPAKTFSLPPQRHSKLPGGLFRGLNFHKTISNLYYFNNASTVLVTPHIQGRLMMDGSS